MRRRYDVACQVGYYNRLIEEWRKKSDDNFVVGAVLTGLSKTFDCIPMIFQSQNGQHMASVKKSWCTFYLTFQIVSNVLELQLQCVSK